MQTLHREFIKAGIRAEYGTLKEFERAYGLAKDATKGVLQGKQSARTVAAIAEVLKESVDVINASVKVEGTSLPSDIKSPKVDLHRINSVVE